jgi:hypothetical protein
MSGHNIITIGVSADGLEAPLASEATVEDRPAPSKMEAEIEIATGEINAPMAVEKLGRPSEFTCPECHGVLWELNDKDLLRFRCREGHAYLAESLHEEQSETDE